MKRIVFIILILVLTLFIKIEWARGERPDEVCVIDLNKRPLKDIKTDPNSFSATVDMECTGFGWISPKTKQIQIYCKELSQVIPSPIENTFIYRIPECYISEKKDENNNEVVVTFSVGITVKDEPNKNGKPDKEDTFEAVDVVTFSINPEFASRVSVIRDGKIIPLRDDSNILGETLVPPIFREWLSDENNVNNVKKQEVKIDINKIGSVSSNFSKEFVETTKKIQERRLPESPPSPPDPCAKYETNILGIAKIPNGFPWLGCKLTVAMINVAVFFLRSLIWFIAAVIKNIAWFAFQIMSVWLNSIVVPLVDFASSLNPFTTQYQNPPGYIVWRTLRDLAYIVLVFIALYAAFVWLQEGMGGATPIIFNVLLVALIINFSYAFVKLAWDISFNIQHGITFNMPLGAGIAAAFWSANPLGSWWEALGELQKSEIPASTEEVEKLTGELGTNINEEYQEYVNRKIGELQKALLNALAEAGKGVIPLGLLLFLIVILSGLIVFFILRYVYILILAGFSPFAILSLAVPQAKRGGFAGIIPTIFAGISSDWFNKWVENLTKWLINGPLIIIFIVLGIVIQQNFVVNFKSQNVDLASFMLAFAFMTVWFLFTWNLAISVAGKWAERIGIGANLLPGILGLKIGNWILRRTGAYYRTGELLESLADKIKRNNFLYNAWGIRSITRPLTERMKQTGGFLKRQGAPIRDKDKFVSWLQSNYIKPLDKAEKPEEITKIVEELIKNEEFTEEAPKNEEVVEAIREAIKNLKFEKKLAIINSAQRSYKLSQIKDYFEKNTKERNIIEVILEDNREERIKKLSSLIPTLTKEELDALYRSNLISVNDWGDSFVEILIKGGPTKENAETVKNILSAVRNIPEFRDHFRNNVIGDDGSRLLERDERAFDILANLCSINKEILFILRNIGVTGITSSFPQT